MRFLPSRRVDPEARILAEAMDLMSDGVAPGVILDLYPGDAEWLAPHLGLARGITAAYASEEARLYFEARLRSRFLGAARSRTRVEPRGTLVRLRAAAAGGVVVVGAFAVGAVTLALVTGGRSTPDDLPGIFNGGNGNDTRVEVQLLKTEVRVYELDRLTTKGDVSAADVDRLAREAKDLADVARTQPLDDAQKTRLKSIGEQATTVLTTVATRQASLDPAVNTAIETVNNAVAAGLGTTVGLPPAPAATPSLSTATASPAPATPSATVSPAATAIKP